MTAIDISAVSLEHSRELRRRHGLSNLELHQLPVELADVLGIRVDNWKFVFMEQRSPGTLALWAEPFAPLRFPKIYNLRTDPVERADTTSNTVTRPGALE